MPDGHTFCIPVEIGNGSLVLEHSLFSFDDKEYITSVYTDVTPLKMQERELCDTLRKNQYVFSLLLSTAMCSPFSLWTCG